MLEAMGQLALHFLYMELGGEGNAEAWYSKLRLNNLEKLFPYLIEPDRASMAQNYYVLFADPQDPDLAILEARAFVPGDAKRLPFVQSTGSQSPALGPVLKRTYNTGKGGGPSGKILQSTLRAFQEISKQNKPWSDYFAQAFEVFSKPKLKYDGQIFAGTALLEAVRSINETKTALLGFLYADKLPGEVPEYVLYLQTILAEEKYSTSSYPPVQGVCALSGEVTTVYPNALMGAGINISNVDREGAFAGLSDVNGWKKFSLSASSADLLYTFSFHVRKDFLGRVAGAPALILPEFQASAETTDRQAFLEDFITYVNKTREGDKVGVIEGDLAYYAKIGGPIASLTIVWADFRQKIEGVNGLISDILPSRLTELSDQISNIPWSTVFPTASGEVGKIDLSFNHLAQLLRRQGGKKWQKVNDGKRLFALKRQIAACAYHGLPFPWDEFWAEAIEVARSYLAEALTEGNTYGLQNEGMGKKGPYFTLAGWLRHLARFVYFLRKLEGSMIESSYSPHREELADFFSNSAATAGIDNDPKRYAFLLGALFGRLIQIQEARGVNAAAGALTWLKRLDLSGRDLPEVYAKVCGKLLEYENDTNQTVRSMARSRKTRALVEEVSWLGAKLGGDVSLSSTEAPYYLLLGKALSRSLISNQDHDDHSSDPKSNSQ